MSRGRKTKRRINMKNENYNMKKEDYKENNC